MSNQAFLLEGPLLATLSAGETVELDGAEGHHAVTVKRVRAGEQIDLLDGAGTRASCTVEATDKASLRARVNGITADAGPALETVLVQALAKGDRDLQAVEAAVELGIDAVVPWQSDRSVVRWAASKAEKGRAKWAATVRSALKQSRRTRLPEVAGVVTTAQLARQIATPQTNGAPRLAIILHEAATEPLSAVVREFVAGPFAAAGAAAAVPGPGRDVPARASIMLVVGPEGGISDEEMRRLTDAGARTAILGTNVLRASTAGPAALVLTRHLAGLLDAG